MLRKKYEQNALYLYLVHMNALDWYRKICRKENYNLYKNVIRDSIRMGNTDVHKKNWKPGIFTFSPVLYLFNLSDWKYPNISKYPLLVFKIHHGILKIWISKS